MTLPIALLLVAIFIFGAGLFTRAYRQGMRFGERMEAKKKNQEQDKKPQ